MKYPKNFIKNNKSYILIKEYPNFAMYERKGTKFRECFDRFDLGMTEKRGRKEYDGKNRSIFI